MAAGTDGAWLSLDDAADHPETFWLSVATALQRARPGAFDATEQLATRSRTDSALFVMQFLDDAAALERSLEFVLEDFHVLRNPAIIASFASVIENLPAQLRFVITSRSDPALPTARWRARSWVADIRQRDLAFDEDETRSFLPPSAHRVRTGRDRRTSDPDRGMGSRADPHGRRAARRRRGRCGAPPHRKQPHDRRSPCGGGHRAPNRRRPRPHVVLVHRR
jgi:ATP-dependent transcriptional regulator